MHQSLATWQLFEDLARSILEANNFDVTRNRLRGDQGFDLLANLGNESWAIEVKYYRTARAQPALIDAAARLEINGITAQAGKGMLIVSCFLPGKLERRLNRSIASHL